MTKAPSVNLGAIICHFLVNVLTYVESSYLMVAIRALFLKQVHVATRCALACTFMEVDLF